MAQGEWQVSIDTGGTFTDGVAVSPAGEQRRVKVLTSSALRATVEGTDGAGRLRLAAGWELPAEPLVGLRLRPLGDPGAPERRVAAYDAGARALTPSEAAGPPLAAGTDIELVSDEAAPIFAARLLTGTAVDRPLPPCRLRLSTTLGTNALLERRGEAPVLFVTAGFADLLEIGDQRRPELFALDIRKPAPLHAGVVEVPGRLSADGAELAPLELERLAPEVAEWIARGARTAAVALLHAYRNPEHERRLESFLLAHGFTAVSRSSDLAPRIKLLPRAETAVADAYLAPLLGRYVAQVRRGLGRREPLLMTSSGGLVAAERFRPKDALLSGPAGGVAGCAHAGRQAGETRLIGFDMGGTSTDVSRYAGDFDYVYEHAVGGVRIAAPALDIETVAAGGGSVCRADGRRLAVGPESAGAHPGPACYGAGGPLTLTDVNLLLGRLDAEHFAVPIRSEPAARRLAELQATLAANGGEQLTAEALLSGLLDIADETMAAAIRRAAARRGYDPQEHVLVACGGAGAQHACAVAERLDMRRVLVPVDAALLGALGLGHAAVERFEERQLLAPLDGIAGELGRLFDELAEAAGAAVTAAGVDPAWVSVRRRLLHLRLSGQETALEVDWTPGLDVASAFFERYADQYGHRPEPRPLEVESMRVVAASLPAAPPGAAAAARPHHPPPHAERRVWGGAGWVAAAVFLRERLAAGAVLDGPALVFEARSATWIGPGWRGQVDARGALVLERHAAGGGAPRAERPVAVRLELWAQRFEALVREMGQRLERTAVSTNVKERLDFSCALLDGDGVLVANAPHIPVHLGALGLCVRTVAERLPPSPGDVLLTNHPAYGGSHLPDVTVITPVFETAPGSPALLGWVASRAHHAEIGGIRPGSMPPAARRLVEEGVVLAPLWLVRGGVPRWEAVLRALEAPPYPSRNVQDNLADLRAAVAANQAGAQGLLALAAAAGAAEVRQYMAELRRFAAERVANALAAIPDGEYHAVERLDDGTPLAVCVTVAGRRARVDFSGTGPVHPGNLNATPAIVRSAVLYVLRLLIRQPLPLNEGLLDPVELVVPPGLLAPPFPDDPARAPAVVGGNVETSQRLVDTLLRALGLAACSQGTMNNVIFGNARFGYYETLGGGAGAGPGFSGASAVHTHMTNTRITDAEVLEQRYPVRVERFAVRRGSGGSGRFRGGDGLVRQLLFLEPVSLSVLTQHRTVAPFGLGGGGDGRPGAQRVIRADGTVEELGPIDERELHPGDRLVVETPGGGGFGADQPGGGAGSAETSSTPRRFNHCPTALPSVSVT